MPKMFFLPEEDEMKEKIKKGSVSESSLEAAETAYQLARIATALEALVSTSEDICSELK